MTNEMMRQSRKTDEQQNILCKNVKFLSQLLSNDFSSPFASSVLQLLVLVLTKQTI